MSSIGRNISANLISNVWSTALSLLLTPLYVKFLGVESYGLIGFHLSWIAIVSILDTGISLTAMREIAWLGADDAHRRDIPPLMRTLEVAYWVIVSAIGLAILIGAWWFGERWFTARTLAPATVRDALMLMAVSLVVQIPSGLYVGGLMGMQRQVECSGLLAVFGTVRGVGSIVVLSAISHDIRAFFIWQIIASALQTGWLRTTLWRHARHPDSPARFSVDRLHAVKGFASGMIVITALSSVMNQADKMVLSRTVPLQTLGYYMLASAAAAGLSRVVTPLIQAFNPRFTEAAARGDDAGLARQFRLASRVLNVVVVPPAVVLAVLAHPVLRAWIGTDSVAANAALVLPPLVAGTALSACSFPALGVLYSRKELRPVIVTQAYAVVVLLPLLIWAATRFGVYGAAVAWSLYGLTQYVAFQTITLRRIGESVSDAIGRDLFVPLIASILCAAAYGRAMHYVDGRLAVAAAVGLGLVLTWIVALLASKDLVSMGMSRFRLARGVGH